MFIHAVRNPMLGPHRLSKRVGTSTKRTGARSFGIFRSIQSAPAACPLRGSAVCNAYPEGMDDKSESRGKRALQRANVICTIASAKYSLKSGYEGVEKYSYTSRNEVLGGINDELDRRTFQCAYHLEEPTEIEFDLEGGHRLLDLQQNPGPVNRVFAIPGYCCIG